MKIALIIFPLHPSHGCILQTYALYYTLKKKGHDVTIVNRQWAAPSLLGYLKRIGKNMYLRLFHGYKGAIFYEGAYPKSNMVELNAFIEKYLKADTITVYNERALKELSHIHFDAYIVGSDQTWRPKYVPNIYNYYLNFIPSGNKVKRISYAASFGTEDWEYNQIQEDICRKLISKFSAISVREDSGIKICRDYFHVNAQLVVDPTLLLTLEEYKELVNYTSSGFDNSLSCYLLDKTINKEDVVEYVSRVKGLIPVYVNTETENSFAELGKQIAPSIESWIGGFIRAEFVVNDSFHAMLFSVLFNKPFIVIGNRKRGIIRFISFLNSIGLEERLVSDTSSITLELINKSVDWELVNNKIFSLRRKSINFLMAALK